MARPNENAPVTVLGAGRFLRLNCIDTWEYAERIVGSGVVVIVAVTPDDRLLFVEQYRPALRGSVIELPAGLVGDDDGGHGESFETAGRRELIEETGYDAEDWSFITEGPASSGMSNEIVSFYRARTLRKVGDGGGVHGEDITVHEVPVAEADRWLRDKMAEGIAVDPKVCLGLYDIQNRPGE